MCNDVTCEAVVDIYAINLNKSVMVMGSPETCKGDFGEGAEHEIYNESLCF